MAASTCRRSSLVRATNRCSAPAPRSKPSITTYSVSISATTEYQSSTMDGLRTVRDLAADQIQEQHAEDEIDAAEADQREERRAGVYGRARARRRAHQSVHQPRLPPELRR